MVGHRRPPSLNPPSALTMGGKGSNGRPHGHLPLDREQNGMSSIPSCDRQKNLCKERTLSGNTSYLLTTGGFLEARMGVRLSAPFNRPKRMADLPAATRYSLVAVLIPLDILFDL